jgi:hypothetical protein
MFLTVDGKCVFLHRDEATALKIESHVWSPSAFLEGTKKYQRGEAGSFFIPLFFAIIPSGILVWELDFFAS